MQVNFRIWGNLLGLTKSQLLDPYINAWAGGVILRYYLSRYPFWEAIGRYHSVERNRQIGYAWRVYRALLPNGEPAREPKGTIYPVNRLKFSIQTVPDVARFLPEILS